MTVFTKLTRLLCLFLLLAWVDVQAQGKISTRHDRNLAGFARIKVINETDKVLACYVAIDGRKIRFRLDRYRASPWYKATDIRFNHRSFNTWCDYANLWPDYEVYKKY